MLSVKLGNCGEPRESVRREGKEGDKRRINCGGGFFPGGCRIMRNRLIIEIERERERETKLAEVQKLSTLLQQKKYAGEKNPISSPDLQHNEHQFCGLNLLCPSHKMLEHHL